MTKLAVSDIHGQLKKIKALVENCPPSTTVLVVGDLIDNSMENQPDHKGTINHIKQMVDQGIGNCLMGNHELNAIGWSLKKEDGTYCRPHTIDSNRKQHESFLKDFPFGTREYLDTIEWFKTLPIFVETDTYRAVHACWDSDSIDVVRKYTNADNSIKTEHWYHAFDKEHELYIALEVLLKGRELDLPQGLHYFDKTGTKRTRARLAWWSQPNESSTLYDLCQSIPDGASDIFKKYEALTVDTAYFSEPDKLTLIGHYTLPSPKGMPERLSQKVLCLDFNAAKGQNPLYGYLFDEKSPDSGEFVSTNWNNLP